MPRYIDADDLYRRVKTKTNPYGKPTLDYESGVKVLDMIKQAPTADVAPRAEVAREIFEEIEKLKHTKWDWNDYVDWDAIAELKKKYTEDENGGK